MVQYEITGLPDLITTEWARKEVDYLRNLYHNPKLDHPGYAVDLASWNKKVPPPPHKTDERGIVYLPFLPTLAEFERYLQDGVIGPYVRWIANQGALEILSKYIYGKHSPQYAPRHVYGWEEKYIREKGWMRRDQFSVPS